jgi:carboxylate-amine ligase
MRDNFTGPAHIIGIEEELMILDAESLELANAVETLLEADTGGDGHVKPELHESVLEVATEPAATTAEAGRELRALRRRVADAAAAHGLAIASAGTHPLARWEDQRIAGRDRYRDLIADLRFVARQEIIFGLHVHVAVDNPDKAIHVANGMRVHLPVLLALSANSPFWRGDPTGLASARTPIFRAFPRVGVPPAYADFADWEARIGRLQRAGVIADHTYLWYDVRPHPHFGTVEVRVMDAQTRVEHTLGLAALVQAMVKELGEHADAGGELPDHPWEMLDENKWLAARHGLDGELIDLPGDDRVSTRELARGLLDRLREHAQDLGSAGELEAVDDLLERGNGARRQVVVYEANHDLHEVVAEIRAATVS